MFTAQESFRSLFLALINRVWFGLKIVQHLGMCSDEGGDHHEHSEEKTHGHTFNEDAEKMIKKVKQALANGEGCRVLLVL